MVERYVSNQESIERVKSRWPEIFLFLCCSQIDVKKSVPQESKPKARKIFVGGLAPETREGMFRRCMRVSSMQITEYTTSIIMYNF